MQRAISETHRRRELQQAYNVEHDIDPQTIRKAVTDILAMIRPADTAPTPGRGARTQRAADARRLAELAELPPSELGRLIQTLEEEMAEAAADLRFEYAARLRDEIKDLRRELREAG
jgi:excinuclease ABC subunit B